jgi:hypothetical protein
MTRLLTAQRRLFLFLVTALFTILIRIVLLPLGGSKVHAAAITYSDRGELKQFAVRFTKLHSQARMLPAIRLGFVSPGSGTPYLLRIANFSPFVKVENLGVSPDFKSFSLHSIEPMFFCGSDGDGGDGDGGDGDGDAEC